MRSVNTGNFTQVEQDVARVVSTHPEEGFNLRQKIPF